MSHPLRVCRPNRNTRLDGMTLVARPSRWGNPFRVEEHGRARAVELYEAWLLEQPDLMAQLPRLRGRLLVCYCRLDQLCHADVLARLANGDELEPGRLPEPSEQIDHGEQLALFEET
jgi:hypothetical protein